MNIPISKLKDTMQISTKLITRFRNAKRIAVLTGAGISAESGVPTFRGSGETTAVWKGMPFDQISSARMVRENLNEVWEWFDYRRDLLRDLEPNPAHYAIAEWRDQFEETTLSIRRKRELAQKENQELSSLRDWLLPMLMNGQVRVNKSLEEGKVVNKAKEAADSH